MSIPPISGAGFTLPTPPTTPAATGASGGTGFGDALVQALDGVAQSQTDAGQVAQLAATGDLTNVHDLTIATSEAELATTLTTAVRDKAVAAFNAIMSMPV
jgi:flagellar hook-basal body complex protein FliE